VSTERVIRIIGAAIAVGVALLGWNQVARDLGGPVNIGLALDSGNPRIPVPRGGTAHVVDYGVNTVSVDIRHLSVGLQWMIAVNVGLQFLIIGIVLFAIANVWIRTSAGHPFAPSVTVSLVAVAVSIGIGGTACQLLGSFSSIEEAREAVGSGSPYYYQGGLDLNFTWLVVGLLVGVLASAFAIGARLQLDNADLKRDTEGLV
jgi:hypothetical protein